MSHSACYQWVYPICCLMHDLPVVQIASDRQKLLYLEKGIMSKLVGCEAFPAKWHRSPSEAIERLRHVWEARATEIAIAMRNYRPKLVQACKKDRMKGDAAFRYVGVLSHNMQGTWLGTHCSSWVRCDNQDKARCKFLRQHLFGAATRHRHQMGQMRSTSGHTLHELHCCAQQAQLLC